MRSLSIATVLFFSLGLVGAEPPSCSKSDLGKFWPEEANDHPMIAAQLAREGELRVCGHKGWHYRWMQPAVRVDQLRGKHWKNPPTQGEADRQKPTE